MEMPPLDPAILARRSEIVGALRAIVPGEGVIDDLDGMRPYECDALSAYRQMPLVVVLPETVDQVAAILRYCQDNKVKVVPRGAGTSLSGGSMPVGDAILLGMSKFNRVLEIDYANRCARVQPGVTNLGVTKAVEHEGFYYAPDPSSQIACSIGGNVAENSGGVHCLKYGLTTNNLLGLEVVLMDGAVIRLGGKHLDAEGYDLMGVLTGSEGLLGVVTEVTVRILRKPEVARALLVGFSSVVAGGACVGRIIAAGIIPAGIEMMDRPAIHAAEAFCAPGYPMDVEALLIVEVEGSPAEIDAQLALIKDIARRHNPVELREAQSEDEAKRIWLGRKSAFGAMGQINDYMCLDGTIPVSALPRVLRRIGEMSRECGLDVANVFHAGDGNMHPLILYDVNKPGDLERCEAFGAEILKLCVEVGGCLTGEHGVGIEKRDLMTVQFAPEDLEAQMRVKDVFDPKWLLNPAKVFPLAASAGRRAG